MAVLRADAFLLENGTGRILLEDGVSLLLLEILPYTFGSEISNAEIHILYNPLTTRPAGAPIIADNYQNVATSDINEPDDVLGSNTAVVPNQGIVLVTTPAQGIPESGAHGTVKGRFDQFSV